MYRFIALAWNDEDQPRTAAAQRLAQRIRSMTSDWQSVLDLPGLRVFHARGAGSARRAYPLAGTAGVVLGKLFDDSFRPADTEFGDAETGRLLASEGRRLIERYWGHYVAFLSAADSGRRFVLRDPTGGLPCYVTRASGVDVFLSDMEDYARLELAPFAADLEHLTAFFLYSELATRSTGIEGVTQLFPGECAAIGPDRRRRGIDYSFYWNPVDVAAAGGPDDADEARAILGSTIRRSVGAWASSYRRILQELSGGLDSSIVGACAAAARPHPEILGFHVFGQTAEGDDRVYARAAAARTGIELVEAECRSSATALEDQLDPLRVASPAVLGFLPESERLRRRLARARRAEAVFTGQGGDHLFQQAGGELIAAEYFERRGLRPALAGIVADSCRMTQLPVWSVLAATFSYGLLGRRFDPYEAYAEPPSILSADARAALKPEAWSHPWVEGAGGLPAVKTRQVFNVVDSQTFYLRPCPYAERVHPLLSQPIIECSLRIPGYVLALRGQSRGLVREAFAADLPGTIVQRFSKGSATSYFNRMLYDNAAFLREFLLDGALVRAGILDRRALEASLSEAALVVGDNLHPVLDAARTEAWFYAWTGERRRKAA